MYIHIKNVANINKSERTTHAQSKIVFKTVTKCTGKYLGSSFYKGTLLWNTLSENTQKSCNILKFVENIPGEYQTNVQ